MIDPGRGNAPSVGDLPTYSHFRSNWNCICPATRSEMAVDSCWAHVLIGEPVPTSPEHALRLPPNHHGQGRALPYYRGIKTTSHQGGSDASYSTTRAFRCGHCGDLRHTGRRPAGDHAARGGPVQRRSRLQQGAAEVRGAGEALLRQADRVRSPPQQRARAGEAVFRIHGAGTGGRLRHRLAGPHVDVLARGAVHRRAVPVPRPRPLGQGARRRRAETHRRRDRPEGRRDADRLCGRRRAQHLHQQAGAQSRRDEGPQGAGAGRADLEPHLPGGRHGADGHRLQRGLQRDPERRNRGRRERGGRRRVR